MLVYSTFLVFVCMFFNSFLKRSVSLANVAAATFRTCKLVYNVGFVLFRYFVFVFERIIINPLISNGIIKFYCRYVDDTLLLIKHSDIEFLLNKFHTFHRDIRFTYDTFSDEPLHFLDLNIGGNKFSLYRKHTFTGQYTHFVSFVPGKHRFAWIRSLLCRFTTICSPSKLTHELQFIKKIAPWNGFPKHIVSSLMKRFKVPLQWKNRSSNFFIATEQHFCARLNGAFCFSISCLVSEIFRFLKHAN